MESSLVTENTVYRMVSDFMRYQYPDVLYQFDYGSGLYMTKGQATKQKRINRFRGWPDLHIAQPNKDCHGLFIEIKKEGTRLKKKDGSWASDHIAEQADMLERLEFRGYKAVFGVGFEEVKKIIDDYLGGHND